MRCRCDNRGYVKLGFQGSAWTGFQKRRLSLQRRVSPVRTASRDGVSRRLHAFERTYPQLIQRRSQSLAGLAPQRQIRPTDMGANVPP